MRTRTIGTRTTRVETFLVSVAFIVLSQLVIGTRSIPIDTLLDGDWWNIRKTCQKPSNTNVAVDNASGASRGGAITGRLRIATTLAFAFNFNFGFDFTGPTYFQSLAAPSSKPSRRWALPIYARSSMGPLFSRQRKVLQATPQSNGQNCNINEAEHVDIERIKQLCCEDPWYQNKLAITKTTVLVADEYSPTSAAYVNRKSLLPGVHKYLGGAKDARDGCIYGIPSHAKSLICLYPSTQGQEGLYDIRIEPLPETVANGQFKWLRGIIANGYLYGIPAWANCVLEVDIDAMWGRRSLQDQQTCDGTGTAAKSHPIINLIPLPKNHVTSQWQWHGASLNAEQTAIYCIPSNAHSVLKVDIMTHSTSLIDIHVPLGRYKDFSFQHTNKWYGGILGDDNAVYGMPYRTCALLRIDTTTDTAAVIGEDYGCSRFNWHGGAKVNGCIYAYPSHADTVLKIDTSPESKGERSELLPIHRSPSDKDTTTNYKWLGGCIGADGNIYAMPADASAILKIDTHTNYCTTFGFVGTQKNKWQGGVLSPSDGCIYCIPADGQHVLRIDTNPLELSTPLTDEKDNGIDQSKALINTVDLVGSLPNRRDKWQGAFFGSDGLMYAIPENGYRILIVHPSSKPRTQSIGNDGENSASDVARVEYM